MNQPQWSWSEPSGNEIALFLARQRGADFSYAERGASRNGIPAGYDLDHNRAQLGCGDADFASACEALRSWQMFPAPWTRITPADAPIQVDLVVAMVAKAFGVWWLNACRVVYLVDEHAPVRRFGFAYGTLQAHVEQGEELFSVELLPDGTVWYDLRAFSRPRYWPVRWAKPLARGLQKRFARESKAAMQRAVESARETRKRALDHSGST